MNALAVDVLGPDGLGYGVRADGTRAALGLVLPGEAVAAAGDRFERQTDSPDRTEPRCDLFGICGSCAAQHMADPLYVRWKTGLVRDAFACAGLNDISTAPMLRAPLASRRRVTLTASAGRVGFHQRASHRLVDVGHCPALDPALAAKLPVLRAIAKALAAGGEVRLTATKVANGIDVACTRAATAKPRGRGKHGRSGKRHDPPPTVDVMDEAIVRVVLNGDILLQREAPMVRIAGRLVPFPPGAFVQASDVGEAHLTGAVQQSVGDAARVADLFCGIGTFALPLSANAQILAVESGADALGALTAAAGGRPIQTLRRDLMRDPLSPAELSDFDAVVFDPPRAGAKAQAEALAASTVPLLTAVSCNPTTLARDCAILTAAGYKITQVVPVDQFVATAHIEVVATLRRD